MKISSQFDKRERTKTAREQKKQKNWLKTPKMENRIFLKSNQSKNLDFMGKSNQSKNLDFILEDE